MLLASVVLAGIMHEHRTPVFDRTEGIATAATAA